MSIEVTIFPSTSTFGQELNNALKTELASYISELHNKWFGKDIVVSVLSLQPPKELAEVEFIKAELYSDIVIFDGSLENDGIKLGDNYAGVRHACYLMDNVIVVSRTELPLNFIPNSFQTNILPVGEELMEYHSEIACKEYTNAEIIEWLKTLLKQWFQEKRLPRDNSFKIDKSLLTDDAFLQNLAKIISYNNNIYDQTKKFKKNKYEHTAFISYRSYYFDNECNGYNAKKLENIILDYHKKKNPNEEWKVLYYYSGSLTQDCLTEYRRWGGCLGILRIFSKKLMKFGYSMQKNPTVIIHTGIHGLLNASLSH